MALEGDTSEMGEGSIFKLAEALDSYIPQPQRLIDGPFLMPVEDVFSISGRGTVVTGRVERGVVKVGDELEIVGLKPTLKTVCTGVEMFRKLLDQGQAGDNVGVLLRGTKREEVERGQVLAKPGSITPHTKFSCEVYVLSQGGGGSAHAVLPGVPAAVLFPDDGRDGELRAAGGDGDGDAGGQHRDDGDADCADRDGRGAAVRDSRGRPDGRRRRRRQGHRVAHGAGARKRRAGPNGRTDISRNNRPVAQLAERRSPKPQVGGSIPSWPATHAVAGLARPRCGSGRQMVDKIKIALAVACVVAGVWGYYYFAETALVLRVLMVMGGLVAAGGVAWLSTPGKEFFAFAQEAWQEAGRVSWPTRKETMQTTAIVFAFVVIMALFLFSVDTTLAWIVKLLTGRGEG